MAVSAEFLNEAANYVHSVAHKWDFIGIKLYQDNLVQSLRYSEKSAAQKLTEILQGWLNGPRAPGDDLAAWRELVAALRSPAVNLDEMARKIEEAHVRTVEQAVWAQFMVTGRGGHDGPFSKPQAPPPNLWNVPLGLHPSQPSAPSSRVVPQQGEEGRPEIHPPDGGGRADSGPVEGVGSLVQQPVEEHGQLAQGDVQRGPGQEEDAVLDGPVAVMEDALEATMQHIRGVLQDHYCRHLGNEMAMEKSFGQRSLPFHEQGRIASAVCRMVWRIQIEGNSKFHGSGSIVSCNGKFYLLTCCHNFLKKADGDNLQHLEDNCIEKEMKAKCKRAKYLFSTRDSTGDFKSTVALKADVVLTNREDPVLIFDKMQDLLAVEVNDPADFPARLKPEEAAVLIPIQPIPLQPWLLRESLLKCAVLLTIMHFPWEDGHRAECLELAVGLRLMQHECQETQVVYTFDTYHGSSGSPVLFAKEGEVVLLAVHRKSTEARMRDQTGTRTRVGYNVGSVLTQDFLKRLSPDDQNEPEHSV